MIGGGNDLMLCLVFINDIFNLETSDVLIGEKGEF